MRKIAVIGLAGTTHHRAPWDADEWERWCMAWDMSAQHVDRWFEPHMRDQWGRYDYVNDPDVYLERLQYLPSPVYMLEQHADIDQSVRYPTEAVAETIGLKRLGQAYRPVDKCCYVESTIGYMLALALHEAVTEGDVERVGIWGIDLHAGEEYAHQRPNAEYLIGRLHGAGVPVFIPPESSLLASQWPSGRYGFKGDKKAAA